MTGPLVRQHCWGLAFRRPWSIHSLFKELHVCLPPMCRCPESSGHPEDQQVLWLLEAPSFTASLSSSSCLPTGSHVVLAGLELPTWNRLVLSLWETHLLCLLSACLISCSCSQLTRLSAIRVLSFLFVTFCLFVFCLSFHLQLSNLALSVLFNIYIFIKLSLVNAQHKFPCFLVLAAAMVPPFYMHVWFVSLVRS